MARGEMILGRRTEVADAGRLGCLPSLAVVDAPRVHEDHRRARRFDAIGHLDNATGVVRKTPRANVQIGAFFVDKQWRLEASLFDDGLYKLRMIGQQRLRVFNDGQAILVRSRCRLLRVCEPHHARSDSCRQQTNRCGKNCVCLDLS